ncbi:PEP/pyruvate-binding domain-containing protein [Planctomycetota bacterium]
MASNQKDLILPLHAVRSTHRHLVGGKAASLARLQRNRIAIPDGLCVTTQAYRRFLIETDLQPHIMMELGRKPLNDMRWEELWDAALRIQNRFTRTPIPRDLERDLSQTIKRQFGNRPVAVRSSAVGEDGKQRSFAGLHASYINIRGISNILTHIKLVWASLWSDAALLYRREIGLDLQTSVMAVVVQELVRGQQSGIAFGRHPVEPDQAVVEAVYGLNQGLVDGTIAPDRWTANRRSARILSYEAAQRDYLMVPTRAGVALRATTTRQKRTPVLNDEQVGEVLRLVRRLRSLLRADPDLEWTYRGDTLVALQARPITTVASNEAEDQRPWYLSMRRSLDNLKALRTRIEDEQIPAMEQAAVNLARIDLTSLDDNQLQAAIRERQDIYQQWEKVYWDDFIPFAHGVRLFGEIYNRLVQPEDPYEFMGLLTAQSLRSLQRNQRLLEVAQGLQNETLTGDALETALDDLFQSFEHPFFGLGHQAQDRQRLVQWLKSLAAAAVLPTAQATDTRTRLEKDYFAAFGPDEVETAGDLLALARASHRLRDDDNIVLGRIEAQLVRGLEEAGRRRRKLSHLELCGDNTDEVIRALREPAYTPAKKPLGKKKARRSRVQARQLLGQPAGPGLATGTARVYTETDDLFALQKGEILICDAIDPNMTFVVPLAAAIVERRGGMLIHGAIIAREYGLPCVTGITDACVLIQTGDRVTVDGFLGIVTVERLDVP